jgi:hemerythrin
MIVPEWSAALSVGDDHLDRQHQSLFRAAADLVMSLESRGNSPHSARALAFLRRYSVRHFVSEETILERVAYPGREAHRGVHTYITRQILELEARYSQGAKAPLDEVQPILQGLLDHIVVADQDFAPYLRCGVGPHPPKPVPRDPFRLGVAILDEDHQEFLQVLEHLHQAMAAGRGVQESRRMLPVLCGAFTEHTRREEMLMEMLDYQGLNEHREAHRGLQARLRDCAATLESDPLGGVESILDFLRFYLTDHIAKEDLAFAPYVHGFSKF